MLALNVVEPQNSGIGGGLFWVAHDGKSGALETIDGRETAPRAATPRWFYGPDGKPLPPRQAYIGGKSAGVPGAVALWALVSPDVDKRLTESAGAAIRLRPDEWRSGDILWLIDVIGDQSVVQQLLKNLGEKTFKGRDVRTRARGADGKPNVTILRVTGDGAAFARAVMGPAAPNARA